jgi:SNF2 family DNA or RNA helicase
VLIMTVASLKEQWKREIKRFTEACPPWWWPAIRKQREADLFHPDDDSFFKITNYEAVIRDVDIRLQRYGPDLIILDEAQRIKNFTTKDRRRG